MGAAIGFDQALGSQILDFWTVCFDEHEDMVDHHNLQEFGRTGKSERRFSSFLPQARICDGFQTLNVVCGTGRAKQGRLSRSDWAEQAEQFRRICAGKFRPFLCSHIESN